MSKLIASGVRLLARCIRLDILSIILSLGHRLVASASSFAEIFNRRVGLSIPGGSAEMVSQGRGSWTLGAFLFERALALVCG